MGHWQTTLRFSSMLAAVVAAVVACSPPANSEPTMIDSTDADMIDRGSAIYQENCASCHGVNLEGQPNWIQRNADGTLPAPPHDATGHTWHHSDELLFELTKWGSTAVIGNDYKSNMPGFSNTLDDDDIWAVLAYIESQWPEEIRAARNAR